ncbi:MAG: SAM-dependent methyltransferase [Thermoleophilaceae bacterium]
MGEELVPDEIFGDDYSWFMEELLEQGSDQDVDTILGLLELPDAAELLDAPCGHGRISNRLAARGLRVSGLDRSRRFLDLARERAAAAGLEVEYVEGDLRELPFEGRFDALLNWFSSFGYFDDEGNRRVLEGFRRALRPGGRLLLEQASRELLVRNQPSFGGPLILMGERGDDLLIDRVSFDPAAGRSHTERIVVRDGQVRRTEFSLSQPTASQLADWMRAAGFDEVEAFDESGGAFAATSRRLLMRARAA